MTALAFIGGVFGPRRRRRRSTPSPPNTRFPTASGGFIGTPKSRFDDDALLADTDCCSARRSSGCPGSCSLTDDHWALSHVHARFALASVTRLACSPRSRPRPLTRRSHVFVATQPPAKTACCLQRSIHLVRDRSLTRALALIRSLPTSRPRSHHTIPRRPRFLLTLSFSSSPSPSCLQRIAGPSPFKFASTRRPRHSSPLTILCRES